MLKRTVGDLEGLQRVRIHIEVDGRVRPNESAQPAAGQIGPALRFQDPPIDVGAHGAQSQAIRDGCVAGPFRQFFLDLLLRRIEVAAGFFESG